MLAGLKLFERYPWFGLNGDGNAIYLFMVAVKLLFS
jgi:hypothetical protein